MLTPSRSLAEKFHRVVDRIVAALQRQRAIEARRILLRYRDLLHEEHEGSPFEQVISVCHEKELPENASQSDAGARSANRSSLEPA